MVMKMAGDKPRTNSEGFLLDHCEWNNEVAEWLAAREGLELTEAHWEIVSFMREHYLRCGHFPNMRVFVKAVAGTLGEEKGNSRYLHRLFPKGPLKYVCKLAGLSKPPHCL